MKIELHERIPHEIFQGSVRKKGGIKRETFEACLPIKTNLFRQQSVFGYPFAWRVSVARKEKRVYWIRGLYPNLHCPEKKRSL